MPKRVAITNLNGSTIDILNVIRKNAPYDYQNSVPAITSTEDIPKAGEFICGTPAHSNYFLNSLINRIALYKLKSAIFNNPYSRLKKGYVEYGETIEEIFIGIAQVIEYNAEKGEAREFKRTIPDVRSVFHIMNWRVMYPITIQDEDLRQAFLSADGVTSLIAKIIDQIYTAAEYDEFLLFKYLLIKTISKGKFKPVAVDGTDLKNVAKAFRGTSNVLPFMSTKYNEAGVLNNTPRDKQVIFMDADFNADFDVNVLASAFHMEKTDFMGRLFLIDNWTSFDNERFNTIRANSDGLEEVTSAELALLGNVKAVLMDEDWFQIYDNNNKFTEKYVASGLYWNYFYHVWKTVSYSPFANAVVFVDDSATISLPTTLTVKVADKLTSDVATILTLSVEDSTSLQPSDVLFVQTETLTQAGIGVQKYGAILIPTSQVATEITVVATIDGASYTAGTALTAGSDVGDEITLTKDA